MTVFFSDLGTRFSFGQYKGVSLEAVLVRDPSYLHWCLSNISWFFLSVECYRGIRNLFSNFTFYNHYSEKICTVEQYLTLIKEMALENSKYDYYKDMYECIYERFDDGCPETYTKYGGSYAQGVMGYSDDDIDTIFDGDPLAYWNID